MSDSTIIAVRRATRQFKIGSLVMGGSAPIIVQSMANVPTRQIDRCVEQIGHMVRHGCEMVRVAAASREDTAVLVEILRQVSVPIVADVHFHYRRALEAIEAGVHKIRLNPGNISDRKEVEEVIAACKTNNVAIRVGVNQGSIRPRKKKGQGVKVAEAQRREAEGKGLDALMVEKLAGYIRIFEDNNFENLVLSAKCHDGAGTIAVNRAISKKFDYPLHLGVTHAGTIQTGPVRSAAAMGALLAEGIGDTIRVSLAGDPLAEIATAWEILTTLKLREKIGPELIACPTCGRTEIDLLGMVEKVEEALKEIHNPVTVAVMGCVVNGPGEAEGADVALCGGKDKVVIYRKGQKVAIIPADRAVEALLEQVRIFVDDQNRETDIERYF